MNELLLRRRRLLLQNQTDGYIPPLNEVRILSTDGKLYKENEWTQPNSNAVGVAVITNNCKFVIASEYSRQSWGDANTAVLNITMSEFEEKAKSDFNGNENTTQIISQDNTANAAKYCRNYIFKNGEKGYLGALGEWQAAYKNKVEVDACMSKIGGMAIRTDNCHWTSTQYTVAYAWDIRWSDGANGGHYKVDDYPFARAFAALPDNIDFK